MTIAAIYARVSSKKQKEDHTINSQISELLDEALHRGWQVPEEWIFSDEGYGGASLDRPGLEAIRDLIYEGQLSLSGLYGSEYNRGTGCRKTARPGLRGGCFS